MRYFSLREERHSVVSIGEALLLTLRFRAGAGRACPDLAAVRSALGQSVRVEPGASEPPFRDFQIVVEGSAGGDGVYPKVGQEDRQRAEAIESEIPALAEAFVLYIGDACLTPAKEAFAPEDEVNALGEDNRWRAGRVLAIEPNGIWGTIRVRYSAERIVDERLPLALLSRAIR